MDADQRFAALYQGHYAAILRYACRRTDPDSARDVAAETFLVAWRRLADVPADPADAQPWLYGVARRISRADALARLGYMRGLTGDFPGAGRDLRHALELYREIADSHGQADALNALVEMQRVTGDLPGAARGLRKPCTCTRKWITG